MTELVTVVPGEAAESDSEEEINTNSLASRVSAPKGVVVQGEASETDSDDEGDSNHKSVSETFQGQAPITPLKGRYKDKVALGIKPSVFNQCSLCQNSAKICQYQTS